MAVAVPLPAARPGAVFRTVVIALTAFFTVVDLFATQAILPLLTRAYHVSPAAMSGAVNATTLGMAIAGLGVALFSRHIDRRTGIVASLVLLAIPTALLAHAPSLEAFTALRIAQGLCMATAFSLTLAHLGERCSSEDQAGAFAAYITGNVASNLVGRLIAANIAEGAGIAANFYFFAVLNLAGAVLAAATIHRAMAMMPETPPMHDSIGDRLHALVSPRLLAGFGVGFALLFAFIGVFTFVNFVLIRPPLTISMQTVGLVYFVFAPAILLTPQAGRFARAFGIRKALWAGLGTAMLGLPLLLADRLPLVLAGMTLIGAGTFFAQAIATGYVSRVADDRAAASGAYLASYFTGGLVGTAVIGQVFDGLGWPAAVGVIAAALAVAALLGRHLIVPEGR